MALLAEEIVEEWLNRQGYFTIRGIKLGVHEIDILAVRPKGPNGVECRHIEVQVSMRPVSFISRVPKKLQKTGRAANSAKRTEEELAQGVREWVHTKFQRSDKLALMKSLWASDWTAELVLNAVKSEKEVELIRAHGVAIVWLKDIVASLGRDRFIVESRCGADLIDLIRMGGKEGWDENARDCSMRRK